MAYSSKDDAELYPAVHCSSQCSSQGPTTVAAAHAPHSNAAAAEGGGSGMGSCNGCDATTLLPPQQDSSGATPGPPNECTVSETTGRPTHQHTPAPHQPTSQPTLAQQHTAAPDQPIREPPLPQQSTAAPDQPIRQPSQAQQHTAAHDQPIRQPSQAQQHTAAHDQSTRQPPRAHQHAATHEPHSGKQQNTPAPGDMPEEASNGRSGPKRSARSSPQPPKAAPHAASRKGRSGQDDSDSGSSSSSDSTESAFRPSLAERAEVAKQRGNEAFAQRDYQRALLQYSLAVRLCPASAVMYSNRSAANAALGRWEAALEDAEVALRLDPGWPRAHCRRGTALLGLGQSAEGLKAFKAALAIDAGFEAALRGVGEAKEAIRQHQLRYQQMWGDSPGESAC